MSEEMSTLKIDDKEVKVKKGTTILQAARQAEIDIPTLCFLKDINEVGDCRMCIVEIEGRRGFATSCVQKVEEGMGIVKRMIMAFGVTDEIFAVASTEKEVKRETSEKTKTKTSNKKIKKTKRFCF